MEYTPDGQCSHPWNFGSGFWLLLIGISLGGLLLQPIVTIRGLFAPPIKAIDHAQPSRLIQPTQLHYVSAGHRLEFGTSRVTLGSRTHRLTMTFLQASSVEPIAKRNNGVSSIKESTSRGVQTDLSKKIPPFQHVVFYRHPWPKVSVVYRPQTDAIMKSEYRVDAGFDAKTIAQIRLQYSRPVTLEKTNGLTVTYALGKLYESAPVAWQEIRGQRRLVRVKYKLFGKNEVGFDVTGYDSRYALVIDPSLSWNTFIGRAESEVDEGQSIAADASGNVYVTGTADGPWGGVAVRAYSGGDDAYVAKLDSNGNLAWITFLGSASYDAAYAIKADGGYLYAAGYSYENWGSPRKANLGGDGFIAKLDSDGQIIWNTFIGGEDADMIFAIAVDGSGQVGIGGYSTESWGVPMRSFGIFYSPLVAKLDSNGDYLWHTFLGVGSFNESAKALAFDNSGNLLVAGESDSTWGTPIRGFTGISSNAFVAKLDMNGNLNWNTFLGGSGGAYGTGIDVDASNNVYAGGKSNNTWGTPLHGFNGGVQDGFIAKLNTNGALLWNTFFGGTLAEGVNNLVVDNSGNILTAGNGSSNWGTPVTGCSGNGDALAVKLDTNGTVLWNTFLGSTGMDIGYGIAVDNSGNSYIGGYSDAGWGTPVRAYGSGKDGFAAKLDNNGNRVWSTFLGGSGLDYGNAITADSNGNIYIGGSSGGNWGSPTRNFSSNQDGFAAKVDTNGNVIWNIFLGGVGKDYVQAIARDNTGNSYVAGYGNAGWGSPVRSYTSGQDGFAAKVDTSGNMVWNTFLGGAGTDDCKGIGVDGIGNVYITGSSSTTWGAPVTGFNGTQAAFVVKLDSSGSMVWNTFLGSSVSTGYALTVDGSGNAYAGGTSNATWGTPVRSFAGFNDAFAAKLNSTGNLVWNTFLGSGGLDSGNAIRLDLGGNVYLIGSSYASWGTPLRAHDSNSDAFVAKLDTTGGLMWNTFIGGTGSDTSAAIITAANGDIYIGGQSDATWGMPLRGYGSGVDMFAAKLDSSGAFLWNIFLGGAGTDYGYGIATDNNHQVYTIGYSDSTWGTPLNTVFGGTEASMAKIDDALLPTPSLTQTSTSTPTPPPEGSVTPTIVVIFPEVQLVKGLINLSRGEMVEFRFYLQQRQSVTIRIYDVAGRKCFDQTQSLPADVSEMTWDGSQAAAGLYLAYIQLADGTVKKKLVLIR